MLPRTGRPAESRRCPAVPKCLEGSLALGAERKTEEVKGVRCAPKHPKEIWTSLRKSKDSPAKMGEFALDQIVEPGECHESETSDLLHIVFSGNPQPRL